MILLGLCGVTLFAVSVAALAAPQEYQLYPFELAWKQLSVKEKTEVQESLNCCGLEHSWRHIVDNDNGSLPECTVGHPLCATRTLIEVCCHRDYIVM